MQVDPPSTKHHRKRVTCPPINIHVLCQSFTLHPESIASPAIYAPRRFLCPKICPLNHPKHCGPFLIVHIDGHTFSEAGFRLRKYRLKLLSLAD
ncbi:hypothetical protein QN277_019939 [Acacia crassicarpa]|uniref:Uncharacterized protein n=1 Tax=Acacia crassicarpa TaxID=499986 RepID=A0AAE1JIR5_9FABA|nr:hypothetical protein QN277_019939 [Acacia crassicarpa]